MKLKHKKIVKKIIAGGIFLAILLLCTLIKKKEYIAEYIFSRGVGRAWVAFSGALTSLLPFSLYELMFFIVGAAIIAGIVIIIKAESAKSRIRLANYMASVWLAVSIFLAVYAVSAAPNYYRAPVPLSYADRQLEASVIADAVEYYLQDFNELGERLPRDEKGFVKNPYTRRELAEIMIEEMKRLDDPYYSRFTPAYKNVVFSDVMDVAGLGGVFFSPTGEANISTSMKDCYSPCTIAHELAHAKGVMRENEANLVAYYITLTSQNDYVRYAGYMNLFFGSILNSVTVSRSYNDMVDVFYRINPKIRHEYYTPREESNFQKMLGDFAVKIDEFSTKVNDFYLKLSGLKEGVDSYNQGRAKQLPPVIIDETEVPQYILTPVQRLIFQVYLDKTAE
jgi:hypothetical protein